MIFPQKPSQLLQITGNHKGRSFDNTFVVWIMTEKWIQTTRSPQKKFKLLLQSKQFSTICSYKFFMTVIQRQIAALWNKKTGCWPLQRGDWLIDICLA